MLDSFRTPLVVVGRILLALMFVLAGVGKWMDPGGTAAYMATGGLSAAAALAILTGSVEVVGGLAVATGFKARWAALLLVLFTLVASFFFHRY